MKNPQSISVSISQFGIEINGVQFDSQPDLKQLVELLGAEFRTFTAFSDIWIWDDLGITAQGKGEGGKGVTNVECLWCTLSPYSVKGEAEGMEKGLCQSAYKGHFSVFGLKKEEGEDPHEFMRRLKRNLTPLEFKLQFNFAQDRKKQKSSPRI